LRRRLELRSDVAVELFALILMADEMVVIGDKPALIVNEYVLRRYS
jgi:hypothetical protein